MHDRGDDGRAWVFLALAFFLVAAVLLLATVRGGGTPAYGPRIPTVVIPPTMERSGTWIGEFGPD